MSNGLTVLCQKLAERFGMGADSDVLSVLKSTAFKGQVTDAQITALMIVAQQYELNPFTKEIYAYPDKNNGIVPVVGVDGWARIINSHSQFDGMDFEQLPESCTCVIYRKDRSHPTKVTEYMVECARDVGPWKTHPYRMLRHKAMIQCARLAFGFVGIFDRDEAERIIESTTARSKEIDPTTGEITSRPAPAKLPDYSDESFESNLPAWQSLIESGKKTAQQIIAMVSTKAILSTEQIAMIEAAENTIEG